MERTVRRKVVIRVTRGCTGGREGGGVSRTNRTL